MFSSLWMMIGAILIEYESPCPKRWGSCGMSLLRWIWIRPRSVRQLARFLSMGDSDQPELMPRESLRAILSPLVTDEPYEHLAVTKLFCEKSFAILKRNDHSTGSICVGLNYRRSSKIFSAGFKVKQRPDLSTRVSRSSTSELPAMQKLCRSIHDGSKNVFRWSL